MVVVSMIPYYYYDDYWNVVVVVGVAIVVAFCNNNMIEYEKVQVVNINNGERIETYIIKGERGSGTICLNGPAARKAATGDHVIIISYGLMEFEEAKKYTPIAIYPDHNNQLPA